jgi:hypothetical protein
MRVFRAAANAQISTSSIVTVRFWRGSAVASVRRGGALGLLAVFLYVVARIVCSSLATNYSQDPNNVCNILADKSSKMAEKILFNVGTGSRCANFAPRGAVKVETALIATNAGTYT